MCLFTKEELDIKAVYGQTLINFEEQQKDNIMPLSGPKNWFHRAWIDERS